MAASDSAWSRPARPVCVQRPAEEPAQPEVAAFAKRCRRFQTDARSILDFYPGSPDTPAVTQADAGSRHARLALDQWARPSRHEQYPCHRLDPI